MLALASKDVVPAAAEKPIETGGQNVIEAGKTTEGGKVAVVIEQSKTAGGVMVTTIKGGSSGSVAEIVKGPTGLDLAGVLSAKK